MEERIETSERGRVTRSTPGEGRGTRTRRSRVPSRDWDDKGDRSYRGVEECVTRGKRIQSETRFHEGDPPQKEYERSHREGGVVCRGPNKEVSEIVVYF